MGKKIKINESTLSRIIERMVKEQEKTSSVRYIDVELTDGSTGTITLDELDRLATKVGYKK